MAGQTAKEQPSAAGSDASKGREYEATADVTASAQTTADVTASTQAAVDATARKQQTFRCKQNSQRLQAWRG